MTGTLLVTPDLDFEVQVKRVFDGDLDAERWWSERLPRMQPDAAAREMARLDPSVVVLGPHMSPQVALGIAESFDLHFPDVCVVLVTKPTARLWERALRAGVREVILTGAEDHEVHQALTRVTAAATRRQVRSALPEPPEPDRARIITVLSPKGGAGKTTVATNLAVQLASDAPGRVAIIDLDLQFGDVATAIGVAPQSTIADAARGGSRLDSTALKVFLEPHPSGLYALVSPLFPAEADEVSAATVEHVLDILAADFSYIVIDTCAGLDEFALAAAERSDDLVFVCVTDVPSVRALRKALEVIDLLGMTRQHRHLVLNRADDKVGLAVRDVEATVGMPVDVSVPTSRAVQISVNQGSPLVISDPRAPAGRALAELGRRFSPPPAAALGRGRRHSRKDST